MEWGGYVSELTPLPYPTSPPFLPPYPTTQPNPRYDELKSDNSSTIWDYIPTHDHYFSDICEVDSSVFETSNRIGDYSIGDVVGEGQFADVKSARYNPPSRSPFSRSPTFGPSPSASCAPSPSRVGTGGVGNGIIEGGGSSVGQARSYGSSADAAPAGAAAGGGSGSFGKDLVVKIMRKDKVHTVKALKRIQNEIAVLKKVSHDNIIFLHDIVFSPKHVYLFLERGGGDLFSFFDDHLSGVSEAIAYEIMLGITLPIAYLHSLGICHRDLKPENILLKTVPGDRSPPGSGGIHRSMVKICDFGLCADDITTADMSLTEFCGSPGFFAPETILAGEDGEPKGYNGLLVDVWSIGSMMLELTLGHEIFCKYWMAVYDFGLIQRPQSFREEMGKAIATIDSKISKLFAPMQSFLKSSLVINPARRDSIQDLLNSEWFSREKLGHLYPPFSGAHGGGGIGMALNSYNTQAKGVGGGIEALSLGGSVDTPAEMKQAFDRDRRPEAKGDAKRDGAAEDLYFEASTSAREQGQQGRSSPLFGPSSVGGKKTTSSSGSGSGALGSSAASHTERFRERENGAILTRKDSDNDLRLLVLGRQVSEGSDRSAASSGGTSRPAALTLSPRDSPRDNKTGGGGGGGGNPATPQAASSPAAPPGRRRTESSADESDDAAPSQSSAGVFKDSLSLRARRHFTETVDTNPVGVPSTGMDPRREGGDKGIGHLREKSHSSEKSPNALTISLPPIEPTTPSLLSAKKALKNGDKIVDRFQLGPNSSPDPPRHDDREDIASSARSTSMDRAGGVSGSPSLGTGRREMYGNAHSPKSSTRKSEAASFLGFGGEN